MDRVKLLREKFEAFHAANADPHESKARWWMIFLAGSNAGLEITEASLFAEMKSRQHFEIGGEG